MEYVRRIDEKIFKSVALITHAITMHAPSSLHLLLDGYALCDDPRCLDILHLASTARVLLLSRYNDADATASDLTARAMHIYFSTATLEATMGLICVINSQALLSFKNLLPSSHESSISIAGIQKGM